MQIRVKLILLCLFLLATGLLGCAKKGTSTPASYMRFKVDGTLVECKKGLGFNDQITQVYGATVRGYHDNGYLEILILPNFGDSIPTGTFNLSAAPFAFQFTYTDGSSTWTAGKYVTALGATGTLTIEIGSRSQLKGKFTVVTETSDDGKPSKTLAEGDFDVIR